MVDQRTSSRRFASELPQRVQRAVVTALTLRGIRTQERETPLNGVSSVEIVAMWAICPFRGRRANAGPFPVSGWRKGRAAPGARGSSGKVDTPDQAVESGSRAVESPGYAAFCRSRTGPPLYVVHAVRLALRRGSDRPWDSRWGRARPHQATLNGSLAARSFAIHNSHA